MSTTITASLDHAVVEVRPGDQEAATQVEAWLQAYATSRDPVLRERIILAYLGLADRLASRFRDSRGTSPEDMRQTARAGLSVWAAPHHPRAGRAAGAGRRGGLGGVGGGVHPLGAVAGLAGWRRPRRPPR